MFLQITSSEPVKLQKDPIPPKKRVFVDHLLVVGRILLRGTLDRTFDILLARMAKGVETGEKIVELVQKGITTRDILTEHAFENAVMHLLTMGGSTNGILHLQAIYHEAGLGELPRFSYTNNRDMLKTAKEHFAPTGISASFLRSILPFFVSGISSTLRITPLLALIGSLGVSIREIQISVRALEIYLNDMEH